jgi:hypothetical protein
MGVNEGADTILGQLFIEDFVDDRLIMLMP